MNSELKMIAILVPCVLTLSPFPAYPFLVHCLDTGSFTRLDWPPWTDAFYEFSFKLPQGTDAGLII